MKPVEKEDKSNIEEVEKWEEADDMAQLIISTSIKVTHLHHIRIENVKTSKDMIDTLDAVFAKKSISSRVYLSTKFYTLKIEDSIFRMFLKNLIPLYVIKGSRFWNE